MIRYVGVDPSTLCGLVILEDGKAVLADEKTSKIAKDPERFVDITKQVVSQLKQGDCVLIEGFSYGSKGRGVSVQYGIGWTLRVLLKLKGFEYIVVTPSQLKKFASGKGNTKKENLVLPIYKKWGFEHESDNVRDAYVLARIGEALNEDVELTNYQKEVVDVIKKDLKQNVN